jgi:hypothetical protein
MALNAAEIVVPDTGLPTLTLSPGERLFHQSQGVRMDYESGSGYPGEGHSYFSDRGLLFLTNARVVYVPTPPTPFLQSLSAPLENLLCVSLSFV